MTTYYPNPNEPTPVEQAVPDAMSHIADALAFLPQRGSTVAEKTAIAQTHAAIAQAQAMVSIAADLRTLTALMLDRHTKVCHYCGQRFQGDYRANGAPQPHCRSEQCVAAATASR